MHPLDSYAHWAPKLDECARRFLNADERKDYMKLGEADRQAQLRALLEAPIARFTAVNTAYFRARWAELLGRLCPEGSLALLEVASGDEDMIPQAMARSHPGSRYVAANMNKILTRGLLEKTAGLPLSVEVYEDDAANITGHAAYGGFGVVAFQHGVNDVVQAILCAREGVDTVHADWMETLPKMIAILRRETAEGTLEEHVKAPFLLLMETLVGALRPGGVVAANHYQFQLDLDWGYPPSLFAGFIPMVRSWLGELRGAREVFLDGYEPNWWLFLRRD